MKPDPVADKALDRARAAAARRDWPGAIRAFGDLTARQPATAAHWYNLALAEIRAGHTDGAVEPLRRAVLLDPGNARYLNNLAAVREIAGQGPTVARLLVLDPLHARARADRAFLRLRAGDVAETLSEARRAQLADPSLAEAVARAGQAAARLGDGRSAQRHHRRYLKIDPGDAAGARRDLARLGVLDTDQAMSPAFVGGVFDGYADRFDDHLTERLHYVGPAVLARLLRAVGQGRVARGLDLGCGSGLSGLKLKPFATHLTGVDLSTRMLDRARARGIYDALHVGEVVDWLERAEMRFPLAMAADVTSYIGDLSPFLAAVAAVLEPGGRLAMTVHEQFEGSFGLLSGETYSHSMTHVSGAATAAGLKIELLERGAMREENKQPLPTIFLILIKPKDGV